MENFWFTMKKYQKQKIFTTLNQAYVLPLQML